MSERRLDTLFIENSDIQPDAGTLSLAGMAKATWVRLTSDPMKVVWRYVFAMLGASLAMGFHIWNVFRPEEEYLIQRLANSIAIGVVFGHVVAFMVIFAGEYPARLRGLWPAWMRMVISILFGLALGTLAYITFSAFFLGMSPKLLLMIFGGAGLAVGFVLAAIFRLPGWLAVILTALAVYIPIFVGNHMYLTGQGWGEALFYYNITSPESVYTLGIPFALLVAIGGHAPALWRDLRRLSGRNRE